MVQRRDRGAVALQRLRLHQAAQPLAEGYLPERAQQSRVEHQFEILHVLQCVYILRLAYYTCEFTHLLGQCNQLDFNWRKICTHFERRLVTCLHFLFNSSLIYYV